MTIKVFSSVMPGEPEEAYHDHGITIEDFVASQAGGYKRGPVQRVSCNLNGDIVDPMEWPNVVIGEHDIVEFRVKPFGDALGFVFPFWGGSVAAGQAALKAIIDVPRPGDTNSQQGSQIEPAKAKANTARLNQTIPELFGRHIRYPDYLCHPRRYYKDTRTQAIDLVLAVTRGEIDVETGKIKIGDTPVDQMSQAVSYALHAPGATLPSAYKNWYPSPEVGASTGSAGIRLLGLPEGTVQYSDPSASTDTDTISDIDTSDYWKAGYRLSVRVFQGVTVTSDLNGDILEGEFQHLSVGMDVFIQEAGGSFGSTYPDGLLARVLTMNASNTEMTLEDTSGDPQPITDIESGSYTADVSRSLVDFEVASKTGTSLTLAAEDSIGDPVSPSLPTTTGSIVKLDFQFNDFTEIWSGPYMVTPAGEKTDTFEIDILTSQGLGEIDGSNIKSRSRDIEIQYRQPGDLSWSSTTRTISGATRDQLGWTFQVSVASAVELEVRLRRNDEEDTSTTSLDRIEWAALRAELPRADSYDDITTMTMTIEGSDQIASQSENKINLVGTRKLEPVGGGTKRATRSIADAVYYMAKSANYPDSRIDIDELQRLDAIWNSRGDYFDYAFQETVLEEAMNTALRAGFAELTAPNSILVPVRDEPRTQFEQPYSPENMKAPLKRSFESVRPEESDGVEVEYFDSTTWTTETIICLLPGDQGIKLDKIKLDGVGDRTRAWRIGMRRRRAQRYRRWNYNFTTELDALNSNYLSYVPLVDDIPGYGQASVLRSIDTSGATPKLIVNQPMDWQDGETHVVAYRDVYGDLVGPFAATKGETDFEIIAEVDPLPELSPRQEPPHVIFGTTARWSFPALITEIAPQGGLEIGVTATNYDDRVYADDDNSPP